MVYAYIRVSTRTQNIDRQLEAIKEYEIKKRNIFIDKESGKDFNRTNYQRLIKKLKPNDLVIIKSIDRLGRNYQQIIEEWRRITKIIKANIKVLDMPLLNTEGDEISGGLVGAFIADLVLQILSFVAENERINIKERQREGIRIAKEKGVRFGRPLVTLPEELEPYIKQYINRERKCLELMKILNVSRGRFYVYVRKYKEKYYSVYN